MVAPSKPPKPLRKVLAEQLKRIRGALLWEQQDLAEQLTKVRWKMDRSAIAKIETTTRNVSVEDLLALAAACNVEPVALLVPRDDNEEVAIAGLRLSAGGVRAWFHGLTPPSVSNLDNVGVVITPADERRFFEEVSDQEWHARRHPIVETIRILAYVLEQNAATDPAAVRETLEMIVFEATRELDAIDRGISFAHPERT